MLYRFEFYLLNSKYFTIKCVTLHNEKKLTIVLNMELLNVKLYKNKMQIIFKYFCVSEVLTDEISIA